MLYTWKASCEYQELLIESLSLIGCFLWLERESIIRIRFWFALQPNTNNLFGSIRHRSE